MAASWVTFASVVLDYLQTVHMAACISCVPFSDAGHLGGCPVLNSDPCLYKPPCILAV